MHHETKDYKFDSTNEMDPEKYTRIIISAIGKKADKNRKLAKLYSFMSVFLGASIVFTLLFEDLSLPTIIAGALTVLNTVIISWFQMEKPYERWRLYRKYHRMAESERLLFLNKIDPYNGDDRNTVLFQNYRSLQLKLHFEWDGLVPESSQIDSKK